MSYTPESRSQADKSPAPPGPVEAKPKEGMGMSQIVRWRVAVVGAMVILGVVANAFKDRGHFTFADFVGALCGVGLILADMNHRR